MSKQTERKIEREGKKVERWVKSIKSYQLRVYLNNTDGTQVLQTVTQNSRLSKFDKFEESAHE